MVTGGLIGTVIFGFFTVYKNHDAKSNAGQIVAWIGAAMFFISTGALIGGLF